MGRAPCCDKANVKKGPWSPEEDAKLKSYIDQHGTGGNWIALPQKIGLKRCGKSCRLRWLNYLRPNLKHGGFSEEEDNIICSLYISIGSRWSIIASQLPGRTDNDIKNYWNTRLKKKLFGKQRKEQQQHIRRTAGSSLKQETNRVENGNLQVINNGAIFSAYWPQPSVLMHPAAASIHGDDHFHNNIEEDSMRKLLLKLGGRLSDDSVVPSSSVASHQTIFGASAGLVSPLLQSNSSHGEGSQVSNYSFSSELDEIFSFNSVKLEGLDWFYGTSGSVDDQSNGSSTTDSTVNWNEVSPVMYQNDMAQAYQGMQQ